jgi:hypothetical protein
MKQLWEHQLNVIEKMKEKRRYGIFHDAGIGKTLTTLTELKQKGQEAIIICPENAKITWKDENKEIGINLEMYNFSSFHKLTNKDIKGKALIVDECHHFSHQTSARSKKILTLTDYSYLRLLSGTPVADKPIDLWMMLLLLGLRENSQKEFYRYRSTYAVLKKKQIGWIKRYGRNMPHYIQEIVGWKNLHLLRNEIIKRSDIVKLEDTADMPEATFIPYKFELTPTERRVYKEAEKSHIMTAMQAASRIAIPRVIEWAENLLETTDKKLVLFSNFTETTEVVAEALNGIAFNGNTKDRERELKSFSGDKRVLVSTYKSGSESLNLQYDAHYMGLIDLPEYMKEIYQALKRIYRRGQEHKCIYTLFLPENTRITTAFDRINKKFNWVTKVFVEAEIDIMKLMGGMEDEQ